VNSQHIIQVDSFSFTNKVLIYCKSIQTSTFSNQNTAFNLPCGTLLELSNPPKHFQIFKNCKLHWPFVYFWAISSIIKTKNSSFRITFAEFFRWKLSNYSQKRRFEWKVKVRQMWLALRPICKRFENFSFDQRKKTHFDRS